MVRKSENLCGLRRLGGEGVHLWPKEVSTLPFCATVGVKGTAEVAVGDELMSGGYGGGKMNYVWLDRVQGGRASGWRNVAVGAVGVRRQLRRGRGGGGGRSDGVV
jgi:hypothetical protein